MTMDVINVETVRRGFEEKGLKLAWVIKQCELSRTQGYALFNDGTLPKDKDRKSKALKTIAKLLGVEVPQILLTLEPKQVKRPA